MQFEKKITKNKARSGITKLFLQSFLRYLIKKTFKTETQKKHFKKRKTCWFIEKKSWFIEMNKIGKKTKKF